MTVLISAEEFRDFSTKALTGQGVRLDVAHHVADGLLEASLRGVDSHGIRLLPHYLRGLQAGRLNPEPEYRFERTAGTIRHFDVAGACAGLAASRG